MQMPLKRCTKDGVEGWKFGDIGTFHTGPNAKRDALRQAAAIYVTNYSEYSDYAEKSNLDWTSEAWDGYWSQYYNENEIDTIRYINRTLYKLEHGEIDETDCTE